MRFVCLTTTAGLLLTILGGGTPGHTAGEDAVDRLTPERLQATRQAVAEFARLWQPVTSNRPYQDVRANLHVHSAWSHDSRGTVEEIVAAARAVGTRVLMFNEHPADHYDFVVDGHRGERDGVLLIPGAETKGLLVFPRHSLRGAEAADSQGYSDLVRGRGGQTFLSHLEERLAWELSGLTGVEIYNTHADFKDEPRLLTALRNPLWLVQVAELVRQYPQEAFSALQDYPATYLKRWDEFCSRAPLTGVSANDAHQNIGVTLRRLEGQRLRIEDALGKRLLEVDAGLLGPLLPANRPAPADAPWFSLRLDPYACSLRHVGTHLLLASVTEETVRDALDAGRAFVAFDWLADASGFDWSVAARGQRYEMGASVPWTPDMTCRGAAPLPATWKLYRDGHLLVERSGREFAQPVAGPGNYRVELWLDVAGQPRVWVLSNPVYVRAP